MQRSAQGARRVSPAEFAEPDVVNSEVVRDLVDNRAADLVDHNPAASQDMTSAIANGGLHLSGARHGTLVRMRITIRVRPGSAHPGVGGEFAGALVVRVNARAENGKATEAALAAVADAFGIRRGVVTLVSGASSRTKIIDVAAGDPRILADLLTKPGRG
jgi:uncharacterized protein